LLDLVYARLDAPRRDLDSFAVSPATTNPLTSILIFSLEWISPVSVLADMISLLGDSSSRLVSLKFEIHVLVMVVLLYPCPQCVG
jgi:hypothetical protein